jgi:hypothetical protein
VSPPDRTTQIVQLNPGFEGDSSFASNALLAENIAETTSKENASLPGKHMIHALKNLKNTLGLHHSKLSANYTHFPVFRNASQKHNRELPPVKFAVALVRGFKGIYKISGRLATPRAKTQRSTPYGYFSVLCLKRS